jgi:hypothetical protein
MSAVLAMMHRRQRLALALALSSAFGLATIAAPATAPANDAVGSSLATPITGRPLTELWPLDVDVQIVQLATDDLPERVVLSHEARVPDGHAMAIDSTVRTPRGRRQFAMQLVARNHPGDDVELEWTLDVSDARYRAVGWRGYVLHRLQLADALELGEQVLVIARADIVATAGEPVRKRVTIDGLDHEIRMFARALRG